MSRLLPVLALAGSLVACAYRPDFGRYGQIEDPAFLIRTLETRQELIRGLVGEGRLGLRAPEGSGTLRMAVEVRKPASIYLETRDILGIARGTFATGGERYYFYRPDENVLYTGPATAENLGRYLPIALPPDRLAEIMLGQIPLLEGAEVTLELEESSGTYLLQLRKGSDQQRVRLGTRDLRLVSVQTRGEMTLDADFSDHEERIQGIPFATTIDLKLPKQRTEVKLRYTRFELNPATDPGDFAIEAPRGARIEED